MMRNIWICAFVAAGSVAWGQAGDRALTFAAGPETAYLMLPPEVVCGPMVQRTKWSPTGQYLAVVRTLIPFSKVNIAKEITNPTQGVPRPVPDVELLLWSAKTSRVQSVLKESASSIQFRDIEWYAGTDVGIVQITRQVPNADGEPETTDQYFLLNATTGNLKFMKRLAKPAAGGALSYETLLMARRAPVAAFVSVYRNEEGVQQTVQFSGRDGSVGAAFKLPGGATFQWGEDGRTALAVTYTLAERTRRRTMLARAIDTKTGAVGDLVDTAVSRVAPVPPELQVQDGAAPVKLGGYAINAETAWLVPRDAKSEEVGLISAEAKNSALASDFGAVSFESQGNLLVRSIAKVPRQAFDESRRAAQRAKAISDAKQAALAVIMNASDNDDNYPSNSGDWRSQISPYLKNSDILNAFSYTFAGGNASKIENVAQTEIGFVNGPGGRAVAYADGHVKWIPNP